LGYVYKEACYANSDALVFPTFYDACSLVVFEAMASFASRLNSTGHLASSTPMSTDSFWTNRLNRRPWQARRPCGSSPQRQSVGRYADRNIDISDGQIVEEGRPDPL
jgi:glycosyltransferase involved in cell wall biosynthesis